MLLSHKMFSLWIALFIFDDLKKQLLEKLANIFLNLTGESESWHCAVPDSAEFPTKNGENLSKILFARE